MIPVLPDAQILLDDGSGTYAFDVTDRVRLSSLDVAGHGRSDEFTEANAGTLTVTLNNDDGALTYGAGFGDLPFGFGGFGGAGGAFYPGQGIRYNVTVGATTASRFTGRLTSAELGWEAETGLPSSVVLTAVDPLASLARRNLQLLSQEEILHAGFAAYYPLGEPLGSTAAFDRTGQRAPLEFANTGFGPTAAFGSELGLPGNYTGLTFTQDSLSGAGVVLAQAHWPSYATPGWTDTSVCITAVFIQLTTPPIAFPPGINLYGSGGGFGLGFNSDGEATWNGCTSPDSLMDGAVHAITVQAGGGLSSDLWVDGVKVDSAAVVSGTWNDSFVQLLGGGDANALTTWGHFAYGSRITDAQVQAIHSGLLAEFAGETTTDRLTRIGDYAGVTTSAGAGMSGQTMGAQDTAGASLLDALQEVAAAEGGVLFADGEGTIVLQGRGYRAGKTAADLTLSADDIDVGTTAPLDDQQIVNQVTVSRTGGATQIYPPDTALTGVELYPASLDLAVDNDGDALRAGQWLVGKHTTAAPRLPSATVDLMRCPQAEQIIAAEIGDRWAIEDMPSQMWDLFGDQTLEGWSETLTIAGDTASWSLTANLLPWSLHTALVLDDPVYGELDAYPLMN